MLQNFLIGLREGLEAALVVSILVAYLVRTDRRDRLGPVWAGVGLAVVLALGVGALLTFTSRSLSFQAQEAFGGFMSIGAVGLVTWMVFWMRSSAYQLKGELQGRLDAAVSLGTGAVAVMAFVAVGREGLETALFLWPTFQANGGGVGPALGALSGLAAAVLLGWLFYRGSVRIDLARFFRITGVLLIVIAAGVLSYGVHDLQEAGILPGVDKLAFDVSSSIPPSSWYGTLLKAIFNFNARTTWLQAVVYVAYLVPTMVLFLRPVRRPLSATPAPAPAASAAPAAVSGTASV